MNIRKPVPRDLEERTFEFALNVRKSLSSLKYNFVHNEDIKQVLRSTGSIGANYIEARESLSARDHIYRLRISRKEAKESVFWLKLLMKMNPPDMKDQFEVLINEANELKSILSSMILKRSNKAIK